MLVPSSSRSGVRRPKPEGAGVGPRSGPSPKVLVWGQESNFLENPISLFWRVLDAVTATVSGVQGIKTFGVETGDEVRNGWTTFMTGAASGSGEVHAVRDSGVNGPLGAIL